MADGGREAAGGAFQRHNAIGSVALAQLAGRADDRILHLIVAEGGTLAVPGVATDLEHLERSDRLDPFAAGRDPLAQTQFEFDRQPVEGEPLGRRRHVITAVDRVTVPAAVFQPDPQLDGPTAGGGDDPHRVAEQSVMHAGVLPAEHHGRSHRPGLLDADLLRGAGH